MAIDKIGSKALLDCSVAAADIAPGTITATKLAGSITNAKLANSTVTINGTAIALGASASIDAIAWQSVIVSDGSTVTTMVAGRGYFVNNTSAAGIVKLPAAGTAGDTIAIKDYAGNFATNKLAIQRNSHKIQGVTNDAEIKTNRASIVLVYIDATKGWLYTNESNVADLQQALHTAATGGTVTTSGDFKIHTFTGDGNFVVSQIGNSPVPGAGPSNVDYFVLAGAGGGGGGHGGGGGAGGQRTTFPSPGCNAGAFPIAAQTYSITVGAGGGGQGYNSGSNGNGSNSVFSTITSAGGGGGGSGNTFPTGQPGGSGGGGNGGYNPSAGGNGNTPPVSPPQGNNGGASFSPTSSAYAGGGGGGIGGAGSNAGPNAGGNAGAGANNSITGSAVHYAGGGGGGSGAGSGGTGGGPSGSNGKGGTNPGNAGNASDNKGGGGGGGGGNPGGNSGGNGGKGVVIIRYKFQ